LYRTSVDLYPVINSENLCILLPGFRNLSTLSFGSGNKSSILARHAFACCSSVGSLCVPSSAGDIPIHCFLHWSQRSDLSFAPGARISKLGKFVLSIAHPFHRFAFLHQGKKSGNAGSVIAVQFARIFPI
jgi:hypothetical protein